MNITLSIAQDYHSTYHDVHATEHEAATSMHSLSDDEHIILGNATCDNRSQQCLHYYRVSTDGDIIDAIQYRDINGASYRTSIDDTHLYVAGNEISDTIAHDGFRLYKMTHDGEVLQSASYDITELSSDIMSLPQYPIDAYDPYGTVIYDDKVIVYGQTYEYDAVTETQTIRGLMIWYNKIDLSYDTMVFLQPLHDRIEIWDADIGPDGLLTFLFDYNEQNSPKDKHYRSFIKYDKNAEEIFRWINPPILKIFSNIHIPFLILDDNSIVTYINSEEHNSDDIIRVDAMGNILWRNRLNTRNGYDDKSTGSFIKSNDGNIIGVGIYSNLRELLLSGFIYKIDVDTGEIMWERSYADRRVTPFYNTDFSQNGDLLTISELSDNSLMLAGNIDRYFGDIQGNPDKYQDLWIMHVDKRGCIEDGCGGQIQLIGGEPYHSTMLDDASIWYYQSPSADGGIIKQTFVDIRTISSMLRTDQYLDLRNDFIYTETNIHNFYVSDNRRQYYYIVEADTVLLYDYDLELGDTFESAYTDHNLTVIETDTMRLTNRDKRQYWILRDESQPEHTLTWIEDIGTYYGVLWPPNFPTGDYGEELLNCYYKNEQLYHINPDVPHCRATGLVSVDDITKAPVVVYPNPASDILQVVLPDSGSYHYTITDMSGSTLLNGKIDHVSQIDLDIRILKSGMYLMNIRKEEQTYVAKFVKIE